MQNLNKENQLNIHSNTLELDNHSEKSNIVVESIDIYIVYIYKDISIDMCNS